MSTPNPYDVQDDGCRCGAWSESECGCGRYVSRTWARIWREGYRAAEAARNRPRNYAGAEVAPESTPTPARNSDGDSDLAGRAWETYAAHALAHADDPDGWDGIEAMRAALKAIGVIQ